MRCPSVLASVPLASVPSVGQRFSKMTSARFELNPVDGKRVGFDVAPGVSPAYRVRNHRANRAVRCPKLVAAHGPTQGAGWSGRMC